MRSVRHYHKYLLVLVATILAVALVNVTGKGGLPTALAEMKAGHQVTGIQRAIDVQERHTRSLMGVADVVGTAVGLTDDDTPAVMILAKGKLGLGAVPDNLEGVPVLVREVGELYAMGKPEGKPGRAPKAPKVDATGWFARPVPIGVSTGNQGECSAGTIGARVKDSSGNVYALSNNHVYALENAAPIHSKVLQPGLYDTNCALDLNNAIGQLWDNSVLVFGGYNYIDAAIALSDVNSLGDSTPANGYGRPKAATVPAQVNDQVQKYGRTTGLTKGVIDGVNAIVNVSYEGGIATFVNQIVVVSRKPFIGAGDSGSLLVTDPDRNPVGLLFAGNSSGKYAIANPINSVLAAFDVSIDGELE
jgi:hypothetical protein